MSITREDTLTFGITGAVVAAAAVAQYTVPNPIAKFAEQTCP